MSIGSLDKCVASVRCKDSDSTTAWIHLADAPKKCVVKGIDVSNCPSVDVDALDKMQYIKTRDGEFVKKNPSGDWARVVFPNMTEEKMDHLFRAEEELSQAGVEFDTGYDFVDGSRDWELDWSLEGAKVEVE